MRYTLKIYLLIAIFFTLFSCGQSGDTINLTEWKINDAPDDYAKIITREDGWKPFTLPASFNLPLTHTSSFTYLWLKTDFTINTDPSIYYGITINRISHTDRVYVNGKLVGERPEDRVGILPMPRDYTIPAGFLKKGQNEIYLRQGVYPNERAAVLSGFMIQNRSDFERDYSINIIFLRQLPLLFGAVFITLFVMVIILYSWNKIEKMLLYFSLPSLMFGLYIFSLYIPTTMISFDAQCGYTGWVILFNLTMLFIIIQSIYRIYFIEINRVLIPLVLLTGAVLLILRATDQIEVSNIFHISSLVLAIPLYALMLYRLYKLNSDKFLFRISLLYGICSLLDVGFETIFISIGSPYSDFPTIYFAETYIILFTIILAHEFMERRFRMEYIYNKLKILENNKSAQARELSITESSEDKLKTVIDFLKENYTSDLSREGLASAVDMNPNYMSRLFKSYTGKKISEYINELRVVEASEKLKDKNVKIIDIALSVGFDSIVTFNRAFKLVTKRTPTEFREEIH
jgi:AraC-like DNA-binding protein